MSGKGSGRVAPKKNDLSLETQEKLAREFANIKAAITPRAWQSEAYFKQLPPDDPRHCLPDPVTGLRCGCDGVNEDWEIWLLMTGRGFGKTRTGANWALSRALGEPGIWVAVCAPTFADVKNVCFEGPSGIKSVAQPGEIVDHNKNDLRITLRNGSIIQGYSAEKPDAIRGSNLAYCWFDEMAVARYIDDFYEAGLQPALRVSKGQLMITTTPRNNKFLQDIRKSAITDPKRVHFTHATSHENWKSGGVEKMIERYSRKHSGDYLGRQEIEGELIAEIPGALFRMEWFDHSRVTDLDEVPEFRRVVIGVDPASTSSIRSDETGMVVVAEGMDREFYTLEDVSLQGTPDRVMDALITAYYKWECELVIGEKNGVGDYFKVMLYNKDPHIAFKPLQAMNAKKIRAQPVSPHVEQGKVHSVGDRDSLRELEEQLCAMTAYDDRVKAHDDRADAWVYAMRELLGFGNINWKEVYGFFPCARCGSDIRVYADTTCPACGAPVTAEPLAEDPTRRKSAIRWASAYMRTCPSGHEFQMKLRKCPQCHGDPQDYMRQVALVSQNNTGSRVYANRDWFGGRKV
jgi:predicted phage terminase large subunit-like protein